MSESGRKTNSQSCYGKQIYKEVYLLVLTELKNAVIAGNIDDFKHFANKINYITNIESQATLNTYHNDTKNPIASTNLVILACKHNKFEILNYILDNRNVLENLTVKVGKNPITPDSKDESCHDAFYYAVLSGNVELIDTLIKKWPGNYFNSRSEELDKVLSIAYEELKLKNLSLSESVEVFVERKLINLRFFSNSSENVNISVSDQINNIKKRIDLVLEKISFLKTEYSNVENLDWKFLFVARFIAQNIHVLKRQLGMCYVKLPLEEMEFCLISFISSYLIQQDINLFYRTILNKSKILHYLENFAKTLRDEKEMQLERVDMDFYIDGLSSLPKRNRDLIVEDIICRNPEFKELYNDYQQIRDIHSLKKISEYLNLASSANPNKRKGQLIIARALQVIGEYLKNTLESPNLSDTTSDLVLMSLPKNTRRIIISLRNSLSHADSLTQRNKIKENKGRTFFIGVKNDIKIIDNVITDILYNNKMKMIRILLLRIVNAENLDDMKKVAQILKKVELDKKTPAKFNMTEHENLEKLIREMNDAIPDKTEDEKTLFNEIERSINSVKTESQHVRIDYNSRFPILQCFTSNFFINRRGIDWAKYSAENTLISMFGPKVESCNYETIALLAVEIAHRARSRLQGDNHDIVMRSMCEIVYIGRLEKNNIEWIEKSKEKLVEKTPSIPANSTTKAEYNEQLAQKVSELKEILQKVFTNGKKMENLLSYKKNKELQAAVEMLVLDIMSILGASENRLENNLLFLDDNSPLLTGKCLRNYLAHGNSLFDVLLSDPSIAVILNAEKLVTGNIVINKKKFGKVVRDDPSLLKDKFDQCLVTIANQEEVFDALEEGNLEKLNICLSKGADINARSINSWSALHFASRGPNLEAVKLTAGHVDRNVTNINGQTPLHIAAANGRKDTVEFLVLKANNSVNTKDEDGKTPLHFAAENGHKEAVEILLKYNANTSSATNAHGIAPLHYAIAGRHVDVVKILLEKETNADVSEIIGGLTSLHIAAKAGCLEIINCLLGRGVNVNATRFDGVIPLHLAVFEGHLEVAKALILKRADVNARTVVGVTSLHYAVDFGQREMVELLLEHGADVNIANENYHLTPLFYAIQKGREEIVEIFLKHKANVNVTSAEDETLLHLAVNKGHLKIVASLLKHGVDIHAKDKTHFTALHYAARHGRKEIAELLIQKEAEVNCKTSTNITPLLLAALNGHEDVADLLIENKASINVEAIHGYTPMYAAAENGHLNVIKLLIRNKAEVDAVRDDGSAPLHMAAWNCHKDTVVFLVKNGANVNRKNNNGVTPLHLAVTGGDKSIVEFLLKNEADVNVIGDFEIMVPDGSLVMLPSTPLELAAQYDNIELREILANNGAEDLFQAVIRNDCSIAENCIKSGVFVNAKRAGNEMTPLHYAASLKGRDRIVNILLENKANPNAVCNQGFTPLHYAATLPCFQSVKYLLHHGAIYNAVDFNDMTPSDMATDENITDLLKSIADAFAKVKIGSDQIKQDLDKIEDSDILKAIINANDLHNKTLITYASQHDLKLAQERKLESQNNELAQIEEARQLLEETKPLLGPNNRPFLRTQSHIAKVLYNQGNYQQALSMFEDVFLKQKLILGPDNRDTLETQSNIASALYQLDKFDEAFEIRQEVYERRKQILRPDHVETLNSQYSLAIVLQKQGKHEEALVLYKLVHDTRHRLFGEHDLTTINAKSNIGWALACQGKYEEALKTYRDVLDKKAFTLRLYDGETSKTFFDMGVVLLMQKRFHKALETFQRVLCMQEKTLPGNHPEKLTTLSIMGDVLLILGKSMEAYKSYKLCYNGKIAIFGPNHPDVSNLAVKLKFIKFKLNIERTHESEVSQDMQIDINVACTEGDVQTVKFLMKNGANANDRDVEGRISLHCAVEDGHIDIINTLLKNCADVNDRDVEGRTFMHCAIDNGNIDIINKLLKNGADVNDRDDQGDTFLHYAVYKGCIDIINTLLENGAVVTCASNKGITPLHIAAFHDNIEIVEILLQRVNGVELKKRFVDVKIVSNGNTALHVASENSYSNVVKSLLKHGATYNITNKEGKMPIDLEKNQKTIELFKKIDVAFEMVKMDGFCLKDFIKLKALKQDEFSAVANARNIRYQQKNIVELLKMVKKTD